MPKLKILTKLERKAFESPPSFNAEERKTCFQLPMPLTSQLQRLRIPTLKVGFALQYIYFKISGRFFTAMRFPKADIKAVGKILDIDSNAIDMSLYQEKTFRRHQNNILQLIGHKKFSAAEKSLLEDNIKELVKKHVRPKQVLISMVELYRQKKIEVPSYNIFSTLITSAYIDQEKTALEVVEQLVTKEQATMPMPFSDWR